MKNIALKFKKSLQILINGSMANEINNFVRWFFVTYQDKRTSMNLNLYTKIKYHPATLQKISRIHSWLTFTPRNTWNKTLISCMDCPRRAKSIKNYSRKKHIETNGCLCFRHYHVETVRLEQLGEIFIMSHISNNKEIFDSAEHRINESSAI